MAFEELSIPNESLAEQEAAAKRLRIARILQGPGTEAHASIHPRDGAEIVAGEQLRQQAAHQMEKEAAKKMEEMILVWKGQIAARVFQIGAVLSDQEVEAIGASLGLTPGKITEAHEVVFERIRQEMETQGREA